MADTLRANPRHTVVPSRGGLGGLSSISERSMTWRPFGKLLGSTSAKRSSYVREARGGALPTGSGR